jgi:transposase
MDLAALFCLPNGLRVRTVQLLPGALCIDVSACRRACACPECQTPSKHVHSYYTRTVTDLPCVGRSVTLCLHVRKFRYTNDRCPQRGS